MFIKRFLDYFLMRGGKSAGHEPQLTHFLKNHPTFRRLAFFIQDTTNDVKSNFKQKLDEALKEEDKLKTIDDKPIKNKDKNKRH